MPCVFAAAAHHLDGGLARPTIMASRKNANLIGAQPNGAKLGGTDFRGADLSGGSISRAGLHETDFSEKNLSKVVITRKW